MRLEYEYEKFIAYMWYTKQIHSRRSWRAWMSIQNVLLFMLMGK